MKYTVQHSVTSVHRNVHLKHTHTFCYCRSMGISLSIIIKFFKNVFIIFLYINTQFIITNMNYTLVTKNYIINLYTVLKLIQKTMFRPTVDVCDLKSM